MDDNGARTTSLIHDTAGSLALVVAVTVLWGWTRGSTSLVTWVSDRPAMTPATAVLVGVAAVAVLLASHPRTRPLGRALGVAVALSGVAVLVDHAVGWIGAWEQLPLADRTRVLLGDATPRPSPNSAVALVGLGAGIAGVGSAGRWWARAGATGVLLLATTLYVVLLGYVTDTALLYATSGTHVIGMSLPSLASLLLLGGAVVAATPASPLRRLLHPDRPGGRMLRVSVPVLLLAPVVVELALRPLLRSGTIAGSDVGSTTLTALAVVALTTVVVTARRLDVEARDRTAAERRFSELLERAPDAMLAVDHDGRVLLANEQACELFGYPGLGQLGLSVEQLVPEPARAQHAAHRRGYATAPRVRAMAALQDIEAVRRDGTTFVAAVSLSPTELNGESAVIVSVRDVTRHRNLLAREQRRSQQLSALMDAMQMTTGLLATPEVASAVASAACELIGARAAVVVRGAPTTQGEVVVLSDHAAPEVVGRAGVSETEAIALAARAADGEALVTTLRGPYGDDDLDLVLLPDPAHALDDLDHATLGILSAFAAEVLHVAHSFESELRLVEQLQAIDRTKDTFLSAVSHELRTPLTIVVGIAQTLLREDVGANPDLRRDLVARLVDNGRRLERLLNDLLDVDRLQRGILEPRFQPRDIAEVVAAVVDHLTPLLHRPVHADLRPVTAEVEAAHVERVVENLVTNADRYAGPDSPVWVRVGPSGVHHVEIVVEDAGPGVPSSLHEDIFRPFHRGGEVATHSPGIGIGLTLVQRFVELHHGTVEVDDREGGGARFRVLLPRAQVQPTPERPAGLEPATDG